MTALKDSFTSTGEKLFWHQEAMQNLRNGKGQPIVSHIMPTDVCNAKCGFCSVGERPGDVMPFSWIKGYLDQLVPLGLKAVIISGGGNPILYKDKESGADFNDLVDHIHRLGLEIGLITNGMPLVWYGGTYAPDPNGDYNDEKSGNRMRYIPGRYSWKTVRPDTLDKLTWCRISMAGLDSNHKEQEVFVPDFDRSKTSLGFSWIMADLYEEPSHKHGWVSTPEDIRTEMDRSVVLATSRLPWIESKIREYVEKHDPSYVRLLCNCLQPDLIPERHAMLRAMGERIDPSRVFSQFKPPRQPRVCYKGYPHPVLNCDGWIYPCDSVVLNRTAGHQFNSDWRICRWDEVGEFYAQPVRPNVPNTICPGCVFSDQVDLIASVVNGAETPMPSGARPIHENFV